MSEPLQIQIVHAAMWIAIFGWLLWYYFYGTRKH